MLNTLKKTFVDTPIAWTKRGMMWLIYHSVISCPKLFYKPFYHLYVFPLLKIGKDGRVNTYMLTSKIVFGCDLHCEYCNAFSPFLKGVVPANELLESYTQWRKKMKPKHFYLTGGEPLLHPELAYILRESAKIWDDSQLKLQTNGLLLERVNIEVLQALKETNCELVVSEHTFEPEHRKRLDAGYARLKQEGVRFVIRPSSVTWVEIYLHNTQGKMAPFANDPQQAWNACAAARVSITISGNKMYKCIPLLHVHDAVERGVLDADVWKTAMTYQPLTLQSTPEEIVKHLRGGAMPACAVCKVKNVIVPARQISLETKHA